jgi:hypothetical protein
MVQRIECGRELYIFKSEVTGVTECLISAHGGDIGINGNFRVREAGHNVRIVFYTEHGESVIAPTSVLREGFTPVETLSGNDVCHNYLLSKYQGRHSDNSETYESIQREVESSDSGFQMASTPEGRAFITSSGLTAMYDTIRPGHIVTIRNRLPVTAPNLKTVIQQVRHLMPEVQTFHCSFCRASLRGLVGRGKVVTLTRK